MKKVGIKTYRLEQFPPNAKVTNQGDRIKRFELTYGDQTEIYSRLMQEIRSLYMEEIDSGNSFKLYWKDEENELIVLANDLDFKAALDNVNPGEVIKIYIVDDHRSTSNQPNSSFPNAENKNSKKSHTHPGITCNGCNSNIYGLRHKCKSCFNYNLCDDCKKKNVHFNSHVFGVIESKYGFLACIDCNGEMSNTFNVCKDCPNRNTLGIYPICTECKLKHHNDHSCVNVKITDLNKQRSKLLDDLENQMHRDEESKTHYGIQCFSCKRDGVVYRSTSFKCENICLCVDCFIQGAFKNMLSFSRLTSEEAEIRRKQNMFVPNILMNTFNMAMGHGQGIHQATMDMINNLGGGNGASTSGATNGTWFNNGISGAWASGNGFHHGAWATNDSVNGPRAGYF